jgi:hypothetical protein
MIDRTSKGLRDHLFSILDRLESGKITPQEARMHAHVSQQVYNTSRLEIEAARFISEQRHKKEGEGPIALPPVDL